MINLQKIRQSQNQIIVIGMHNSIVQSILDFDYLANKEDPSIVAIVSKNSGQSKFFWGAKEILIPTYSSSNQIPKKNLKAVWFLNLLSGRRVLWATSELISNMPMLTGGSIFAEGLLEKHSIDLYHLGLANNLLLIGPSSVGLVIPNILKLGAIGGVSPLPMMEAGLFENGSVGVISASGGMTNELINLVQKSGQNISFALSTGGDRFPMPDITTAFGLGQNDSQTNKIVYYGELGGTEEYKLIELKKQGKLTKPVIIHIAGTVADLFKNSPQFGHAKAKANSELEKANVKRQALKKAGFLVTDRFEHLLKLLKQ